MSISQDLDWLANEPQESFHDSHMSKASQGVMGLSHGVFTGSVIKRCWGKLVFIGALV